MLVTRPLNLAPAGYFSSTPSHGSASSCFMPSEIRCVSGLKRITWTLTFWPICSASDGWLMRRQAMSVTWSRPSTPPRSTKAPYSVMFLTTPLRIWPSLRLATSSERCSARLSSSTARRDTTMLPRERSILRIWNGCCVPSSGVMSRTGRMSTWLPGRNATAPDRSTVKPPLTRPKMTPVTRSLAWKFFSSWVHASSRRAFSRESWASPFLSSMRSRNTSTMSPTRTSGSLPPAANSLSGTRPSDLRPTSISAASFSTAMTRPLTTVPSRPFWTPSDSSSRAATLSLAGLSGDWVAKAIPYPRSRTGTCGTAGIGAVRAAARSGAAAETRTGGREGGVPGSGPGGQRARDESGSLFEHLVGVKPGAVDDDGVGGREKRCVPTPTVARVAFLDVPQDGFVYSRRAVFPQLFGPPPGAFLAAGGDEQLHVGVGADHRADVAAVEHRALRLPGEASLEGEQGGSFLQNGGDHRGGAADRLVAQARIVEQRRVEAARRRRGGFGIGRIAAGGEHAQRRGAVEPPGIEMGQAELCGEVSRQRALARGGRAVDGDDEAAPHRISASSAPSPRIRSAKPGKLEAIVRASSTATGASLARPSTRNAIAIRWSSRAAIVAPPAGGRPLPSTIRSSPSTA